MVHVHVVSFAFAFAAAAAAQLLAFLEKSSENGGKMREEHSVAIKSGENGGRHDNPTSTWHGFWTSTATLRPSTTSPFRIPCNFHGGTVRMQYTERLHT
jgi:hypothetical protein